MAGRQVAVEGQAVGAVEQAAPTDADETLLEQAPGAHALRKQGEYPQRAVQLSFGDLTGGFQARFLDYPEAHPGRQRLLLAQQRRQHHPGAVVGHAQAEVASAAHRFEGRPADHPAYLVEAGLELRRQLQRQAGQLHAAFHPHQQWIAEQFAETPEGVADRRLRHGQALRRAGHVALAEERVEHHQQVEVDTA